MTELRNFKEDLDNSNNINLRKSWENIFKLKFGDDCEICWKDEMGIQKGLGTDTTIKTMSMDEIKNLPVKDLADENCILFLWVTFPVLKDAFAIMEAWGFEYSTCGFNWVKKTKEGKWHFGLGYWTRANSELCLIATKGKPVRQSASVSQIIDSVVEEHSKKPNIVKDKIIELCGDLPRIELFARDKTKGWDAWGNEVSS